MTLPWSDLRFRIAILIAAFCSASAALYAVAGVEPPMSVTVMMMMAPTLAVILWLQEDAARTGVGAVQDLGWFASMWWPVVIPWYAFKSRGRAGWKLLAALMALMLAPQITSVVIYTLFPELYPD